MEFRAKHSERVTMGQIEIRELSRRFGGTAAVSSVSLSIADGDFLVLLGPSGCGKTTLLRMIAGLLEPSSGSILIDGAEVTDRAAKDRDLAMVFQSYALYPHLSVAKNLAYPLRTRRMPRAEADQRVAEVAAMLEIDGLLDRKPKALSGGQRQRVAVGRALVRNPSAFLMDEPLSNLDAKLRTQTRQELTALHRRLGATFVYVTHDQIEAMTMATKIAVLNGGRVEQVGTPEEVYDRPATTFVAGFVGSPAMNMVPGLVSADGDLVRVDGDALSGVLWAGSTPPVEAIVGVRPEHIEIVDREPELGLSGMATVELVENLGSEQVLSCSIGESRFSVKTARSHRVQVGDAVVLAVRPELVHIFDQESGARLEWRADDDELEPLGSERALTSA
jgi:multiple sugar transport system ATP-binding protein